MHRLTLWSLALVAALLASSLIAAPSEQNAVVPSGIPAVIGPSDGAPGPFTVDEIRNFLSAQKKAATIGDPMQRCLNYPDPPGSHWAREGVVAYCRYRLQPTVNRSELRVLLDSGRGAEIDRRLAAWARQPQTHPESFWRLISEDFLQLDPELRQMLETWKQQSPSSAFAFTASGYNFLLAAWSARGDLSIQDTPRSKIDAMETLLARADGDLRRAIKLDPSLALPRAAMIEIGTMEGDSAYVADATKQALAVTTPSLPMYESLEMAAEPRWGGSRPAQSDLMASISKGFAKNPLLTLIRAKVLGEQLGVGCYCDSRQDDSTYRIVFDQVSSRTELYAAGNRALEDRQYEVAVVYLSEASRFDYPGVGKKIDEALAHIDSSLLKAR